MSTLDVCPVSGEVIPSEEEIARRLGKVVTVDGPLKKRAILNGLARGLRRAALKRGIKQAEKEFEFIMGYGPPPNWQGTSRE